MLHMYIFFDILYLLSCLLCFLLLYYTVTSQTAQLMASKKLPCWSSDGGDHKGIPLLYPWERLNSLGYDNWWIDANIHPSSEVLRRPSLARHSSFDHLCETQCSFTDPTETDESFKSSYIPSLPCDRGNLDYDTLKKQQKCEIELQDDYIQHRYGLHRFLIIRDGNCMYRALAQALIHDQNQHSVLRKEVVEFIKNNRKDFENIIDGSFEDFVEQAAQDNAWGSYVELLAVTKLLSINVVIVTGGCLSNPDVSVTCHHFNPENEVMTPRDTVWLSWLSDGHYDVILDRVVDNQQYDTWLKDKDRQVQSDAVLAETLSQEDKHNGIWMGPHNVAPASSTNVECRKKAANVNRSCCTNSSSASSLKQWTVEEDAELARALQKEEDDAFLEQFV